MRDAREGLAMLGFGPHLVYDAHGCPTARLGDLYSCENFEVEDALAAPREAFAPRRVDWKLLDLGREFPKRIGPTRAIVERDRRLVAREIGLEA